MSTKDVHYQVCRQQGMTDEEIKQDWAICEQELKSQYERDLDLLMADERQEK